MIKQSGNVVILILVAVGLFGALAYTFMRGSEQGQGNLTSNQARIAAQELLTFFNTVDKAANKLRSRGCSETDISFANSKDSPSYATENDPATAPLDKSCHVFDPAGGGLNMNMDWSKYQNPYETFTAHASSYNNIFFRAENMQVMDLETNLNEIHFSLANVKTEICQAYNQLLNLNIDLSIIETPVNSDPVIGDENTTLAGKTAFCVYVNNGIYNGGPGTRINYIWLAR